MNVYHAFPRSYNKCRASAPHSTSHCAFLEQKQSNRYTAISYHDLEENDGCVGEEFAVDEEKDVETEAINKVAIAHIREALFQLSDNEKKIIYELYLRNNPKTIRQLAAEIGIPPKTLDNQKKKVLEKLQNLPLAQTSKKSASK